MINMINGSVSTQTLLELAEAGAAVWVLPNGKLVAQGIYSDQVEHVSDLNESISLLHMTAAGHRMFTLDKIVK